MQVANRRIQETLERAQKREEKKERVVRAQASTASVQQSQQTDSGRGQGSAQEWLKTDEMAQKPGGECQVTIEAPEESGTEVVRGGEECGNGGSE